MATLSPWRRRTWPASAIAALLVLAPPVPVSTRSAPPDVPPRGEADGGLTFLNDNYAHIGYRFSSVQQGVRRWGEGELWFAFDAAGVPRVRLKGYAYSPRFGHGEITMVLDPTARTMYVLLKLRDLREAQCISFPFPRIQDNPRRMKRLHWREEQAASHWRTGVRPHSKADPAGNSEVLAVNWTKSYTLHLLTDESPRSVRGLDIRQGSRVVKTVRIAEFLHDLPSDAAVDPTGADIFKMPFDTCMPYAEVDDPLLTVEMKPPHHKSSALGDLLLLLADKSDGGRWPQSFVTLSALALPGDVAVMIEEPSAPDLAELNAFTFDYTARVYRLNGNVSFDDPAKDLRQGDNDHISTGTLSLDLRHRSFGLHGEETQTKVGPVLTDLLAHGRRASPRVYANIELPVQAKRRCGAYDVPPMEEDSAEALALRSSYRHGLRFVEIDELDGEDCTIFATELPRGRQIYIWMDMESEFAAKFLRAEVRKGGRRLRTLDVKHWHPLDKDVDVLEEPAPEWECTGEFGPDPFVHLGLRNLEDWSVQLQDALRALHDLEPSFVVLEMLALAGDVCLMVREPRAPELWRLNAFSFGYTVFRGDANSNSGAVALGEAPYIVGRMAIDHARGRFQLSAETGSEEQAHSDHGIHKLSVSIEEGILAVHLQKGGMDQCLSLPLDTHVLTPAFLPQEGIFDGVEQIGELECDRFSFLGPETGEKSVVRIWISKEQAAEQRNSKKVGGRVCQVQLTSPPGHGRPALVYLNDLEDTYRPIETLSGPSSCESALEVSRPWIKFADEPSAIGIQQRLSPRDLQPVSSALGKLVQVVGTLGLLSRQWVGVAISRLTINGMPSQPTLTAPVDIFSPELQGFSFGFTSVYMRPVLEVQSAPSSGHTGHRGTGEIRVDLVHRRFYLRSIAVDISAGIPHLESEIFYSAERDRIYARTLLMDEGYEQCWAMVVGKAPPPSNPRNPFLRGKFTGHGMGADGAAREGLDKYVMLLDRRRRADLFVDAKSALSAIHLDDNRTGASVGIVVHNWSTARLDKEPLDPDQSWSCKDTTVLGENTNEIFSWDLIQLFLPPDA